MIRFGIGILVGVLATIAATAQVVPVLVRGGLPTILCFWALTALLILELRSKPGKR